MPEIEAADAVNAEVSLPAAPPDPAVTNESGEDQEGKTAEEQASSEGSEIEHKPKGGFQRRIDRLTKEKADKERELEYWREQALRSQDHQPQPQTQQQPSDSEPQEGQYEDFAAYTRALARWEGRQEFRRLQAEESVRQEAERRQQEAEHIQRTFSERLEQARDEYADFDEVVSNRTVPITPQMRDAIVTSEVGAKIAYYLGKNVAEAKRIINLHPLAQIREIGKIEARLAEEKTPADKTPPPQTKAPAPPSPVGKATGTDIAPRDSDSTEEWMRKERARLTALRK